jgi:hypothetical protein
MDSVVSFYLIIIGIMLLVQPLGIVIILLLSGPGSIPGSALGFFSNGEIFHSMYGLDVFCVSVSFVHVLSCVVFGDGPALC